VPRIIAGLGGLLSNPACCVIKDGRLAAAVEQAKISRNNRLGSFPDDAFQLSLQVAGIKAAEIGCIALARPFAVGPESLMQLAI
jgi:carbamoyltransferase